MPFHDPMTTKNNDQQSSNLFVNVIARAISSIGFGVSVVAIGVLWLFPSALGEPKPSLEEIARRKERVSRRLSAPPVLGGSRPPVVVTPSSEVSSISSGNTPRRVYFLEQTRPRNSRRYSAPLTEPAPNESRVPIPQIPEDVSPRSSSSTLVHVLTPSHYPVILDPCEETIELANSDSSSKRSPSSTRQSSSGLPVPFSGRFKGRWAKRSSAVINDASVVEQPANEKHRRRSSLGNPPWSIVAKSRPTRDRSLSMSRSQKPTPSENLFSRKVSSKEKHRPSTPLRTEPYAYPYFAEPPVLVSACIREKREKNVQVQASLGLGRKPPQRRATSAV